ncbi:MAG TPA: diguanylate cyclase, partial [bacterium]|nr:diguanylate cyclase [bacterium]
ETDILGRLGGDEFVGMLNLAGEVNETTLRQRFEGALEEHNGFHGRSFKLSVSLGFSVYDPREPGSAEDLLARADALMYERKKAKPGG